MSAVQHLLRFEITGTATDLFSVTQIQAALREAGAVRVQSRNAFGWANQPKVATFAAVDMRDAERLANAARALLGSGSLPALLPHPY